MRFLKITFRQIDAFKTVVQTGTVTESARMLGVSQPAVSRLISDLENEVGFKLFERSGRNLKATPEALLLVEAQVHRKSTCDASPWMRVCQQSPRRCESAITSTRMRVCH